MPRGSVISSPGSSPSRESPSDEEAEISRVNALLDEEDEQDRLSNALEETPSEDELSDIELTEQGEPVLLRRNRQRRSVPRLPSPPTMRKLPNRSKGTKVSF